MIFIDKLRLLRRFIRSTYLQDGSDENIKKRCWLPKFVESFSRRSRILETDSSRRTRKNFQYYDNNSYHACVLNIQRWDRYIYVLGARFFHFKTPFIPLSMISLKSRVDTWGGWKSKKSTIERMTQNGKGWRINDKLGSVRNVVNLYSTNRQTD